MRRGILGLIALASFAAAAILKFYRPLDSYDPAGAMGLRMGLILGALWLAWPDLHRLPKWVWYILPVAVVVLLYARALLVYLIPAFAVVAVSYMLYRRLWRSPSP